MARARLLLLPLLALACGEGDGRGRRRALPAAAQDERAIGAQDSLALLPPRAILVTEGARPAPSSGERAPAEENAPTPPSAMQLVHEGPIASATYGGGRPMYTGQQIESDGHWLRHGRWDAWYEDGQAWEAGLYYLGEPHGLWEWWYEDGTPQARGEYDAGLHMGPWTYWHANGRVMASGTFREDRPVGLWRLYDEEGNLLDESDRGD